MTYKAQTCEDSHTGTPRHAGSGSGASSSERSGSGASSDRRSSVQNYNSIDAAKFICALLVVTIHVLPFGTGDSHICMLLNYGVRQYIARIAVPFFFIASGFLLFRNSTPEKTDYRLIRTYLFKLFRLYVIWSLIYLPVQFSGLFQPGTDIFLNILVYLRDFIFVGSYWHLWYLNATIAAVALLAFLIYRKVSVRSIMILAFILYLAGLLAQSWFGMIVPLQYEAPGLWQMLKLVQKFMVTTRNGLFVGFLYVGTGMCLAFSRVKISTRRAAAGFAVSMLLLLAEVVMLTKLNWIRLNDMYLFLAPAAVFFFLLVKSIRLADSRIYILLRNMSSLIFYMHIWVSFILRRIIGMYDETLVGRPLVLFAGTAAVSIVFSYLIIKVSENNKFKWLKYLYQ